MSLILHRVALTNFRRFRERHELAGLADGLNMVCAPNEAGKSTFMEAVRAALFLRHGSKTQLIKSFQPYGDSVGPEVELEFEVDGARYALSKRFLSRPHVTLAGPSGKQEGDAAEEALQDLLQFEKQGTGFDAGGLGTLGLLWVPQTEGLDPVLPGEQVRDGIGGMLEGQAGAMLGSATFDRVRDRILEQYGRYRTATGRPTGELKEAEANVATLAGKLAEATERQTALERAFADLEQNRAQLRQVVAELADEEDLAGHAELVNRLEQARAAAQTLETRQAQHDQAEAAVGRLDELAQRHADALARRTEGEQKLKQRTQDRRLLIDGLATAKRKAAECAQRLKAARADHTAAQSALAAEQDRLAERRRRSAIREIRERHGKIVALEQSRADLLRDAGRALSDDDLRQLEVREAELSRAQTLVDAGSVQIAFSGDLPVMLDGKPLPPGGAAISAETSLDFGNGNRLVIRPPRSLESAAAELANAQQRRDELLARHGAASFADLRAIDRKAADAATQLRGVASQLDTMTPANDELGLAAGVDALKLFVAELPEDEEDSAPTDDGGRPSVSELQTAVAEAETARSGAEEADRLALDDLRKAEKDEGDADLAERDARRSVQSIAEDIARIEQAPDFANVSETLAEARMTLAERAQELATAQRNAAALDPEMIQRQIDTASRRRANTENRRSELSQAIAALEARIDSEGGQGLGEKVAVLTEELEAARATLARMEDDAQALALLRDVLAEAQDEVGRTLTGPVAERAMRHVSRILPGSEPGFGTDLALATLNRGSVEEDTAGLSTGTQEQLAAITRLAFAELLREQGKPVSLMLDDPLVYSDDVRLDAMIDLLSDAANDMQIIVFTCRDRAFRAAPGERLAFRKELA